MDSFDAMRFVERQQFFDGQSLLASDLQEIESFHRHMRWLHNKSLHQPGIGNGLAVYGKEGDRQVIVSPGYAIDADGREIVLIEEKVLQVPPVAGNRNGRPVYFDLTVSFPENENLEVVETREGVCANRGTVRLQEEPIFCWVRLNPSESSRGENDYSQQPENGSLANDIERGRKLVVGRAMVLNCQLFKDISCENRRSARTALGSYIACGTCKPEEYEWNLVWLNGEESVKNLIEEFLLKLKESYGGDAPLLDCMHLLSVLIMSDANATFTTIKEKGEPIILPFGIKASIPTESANFQTTPHYSVRIDGAHMDYLIYTATLSNDMYRFFPYFLDVFLKVDKPEKRHFEVSCWLIFQSLGNKLNDEWLRLNSEKENLLYSFQEELEELYDYSSILKNADTTDQIVEKVFKIGESLLLLLPIFNEWRIVWMGVEG